MRVFHPTYISNVLKDTGIVFYCKDCEKIVDVIPFGRKFVYKCSICKTKNVAFGTDKSIRAFYHVREEAVAVPSVTATPEPATPPAAATPPAEPMPNTEIKSSLESAPTPIPGNK